MKPTLTLSFACAVATSAPTKNALAKKRLKCLTILDIGSSPMDRSLTYPRSNFYESVVPHPELNEFARQLGVPRQQSDGRVLRRDFGSARGHRRRRPAPLRSRTTHRRRRGRHSTPRFPTVVCSWQILL